MNAKRILHPLDGRGQRKINRVYWHYSDSEDVPMSTIRQWHQAKGWIREGYHFLIRGSGLIELGRPESMVGAHCKGQNSNSLGICICGSDRKKDGVRITPWYPANVQYHSAGVLGRALMQKYSLSLEDVTWYHRDSMSTSCPGSLVRSRLRAEILGKPAQEEEEEEEMLYQDHGKEFIHGNVWQERYKYWLHLHNQSSNLVEVRLLFWPQGANKSAVKEANPFNLKPGESWSQDLLNIVHGPEYNIKSNFGLFCMANGDLHWSLREFKE